MTSGRIQLPDASVVTHALVSAWQWWLGELRQMLPSRIRAAIELRSQPVILDIQDGQLVVADAERQNRRIAARLRRTEAAEEAAPLVTTAEAATLRDARVLLRFPRQQVLRRMVNLPLAAARNLPGILRFEMERLSPLDPAAISWDWRVVDRSRQQNRLRVEVWMARKGDVDVATGLCASLGLVPAAVGLVGEDPGVHVPRLLPRGHPSPKRGLRRLVAMGVVVAPWVLALALLHTESARRQAESDQVQARIEKARAGAQAAERLRKDIQQTRGRVGFVAGRKDEPLAIAVLAEVTRQLPDDSWLIQFQLNAREVRIQGFAPKASALIEQFGQSPRFANAQFRAPVTPGPRVDLERFDLSFEIRRHP